MRTGKVHICFSFLLLIISLSPRVLAQETKRYIIRYDTSPNNKSLTSQERFTTESSVSNFLNMSENTWEKRRVRKFTTALNASVVDLTQAEYDALKNSNIRVNPVVDVKLLDFVDKDVARSLGADAAQRLNKQGKPCLPGEECLSGKVKIAVGDTGVDFSHPDLGSSVLSERKMFQINNKPLQLVSSFQGTTISHDTPIKMSQGKIMYHDDFEVFIYDQLTGLTLKVGESTRILSATINGNLVAYVDATPFGNISDANNKVYVYNINTGQKIMVLEKNQTSIKDLSIIGNSHLLFQKTNNQTTELVLFDIGKNSETILAHSKGIDTIPGIASGSKLIYTIKETSQLTSSVMVKDFANNTEEVINFPSLVQLVDFEGDQLLYRYLYQFGIYRVRNIKTGQDTAVNDFLPGNYQSNEIIVSSEPAGGGSISGNFVYFKTGHSSPYTYGTVLGSNTAFAINIATPSKFYDGENGTSCILTNNRNILCHVYNPAANNNYSVPSIYNDVIVGGKNFITKDAPPTDDHGHGSHVTGIVHSIAPGATLYALKIMDGYGRGTSDNIIAAMEWCLANNVKILVLSLGAKGVPGDDFSDAANNMAEKGLTIVAAAGNSGPEGNNLCRHKDYPGGEAYSICSPALASRVIAGGALNKARFEFGKETVAGFSSRGPGLDGIIKPNFLTVGYEVCSAQAMGTQLAPISCGDRRIYASGTSMAAPAAAAGAAYILEMYPNLTPAEVMTIMEKNSFPLPGLTANEQGYGVFSLFSALGGRPLPLAVTNSANYANTVAPGSIATIFGLGLGEGYHHADTIPLPGILGNVQIQIEDQERKVMSAPLFYVSPNQINFQVPWEAAVGNAIVSIEVNGFIGQTRNFKVMRFSPSIFTRDSTGSGYGSVIRVSNGKFVTKEEPSIAGGEEYISVYGTGLGESSPAVPTGTIPSELAHVELPKAIITNVETGTEQELPVTYAGLSWFVGVNQINIQVLSVEKSGHHKLKLCQYSFCSNAVDLYITK